MFLILLVFTPSYADLWKVRDFWLNQARMIMVILIPIEKNKQMLVRARVELTTLALSAPRSADWANRPDILHSFLVRCVCLQERHSIKWVTHGKAILHQVALKKAPVSLAKGQVPWKTKQKNSKLSSRSLWVSLRKTTKNHLDSVYFWKFVGSVYFRHIEK